MALRIGLDIDGTISIKPDYFAAVCKACYSGGGDIHIVTSRSQPAEQATRQELDQWEIQFHALYFLPSIEIAQKICPYTSIDWYQCYLWQKVQYAELNGLTHFVDDDARVISLFEQYAKHIQIISADNLMYLDELLFLGTS